MSSTTNTTTTQPESPMEIASPLQDDNLFGWFKEVSKIQEEAAVQSNRVEASSNMNPPPVIATSSSSRGAVVTTTVDLGDCCWSTLTTNIVCITGIPREVESHLMLSLFNSKHGRLNIDGSPLSTVDYEFKTPYEQAIVDHSILWKVELKRVAFFKDNKLYFKLLFSDTGDCLVQSSIIRLYSINSLIWKGNPKANFIALHCIATAGTVFPLTIRKEIKHLAKDQQSYTTYSQYSNKGFKKRKGESPNLYAFSYTNRQGVLTIVQGEQADWEYLKETSTEAGRKNSAPLPPGGKYYLRTSAAGPELFGVYNGEPYYNEKGVWKRYQTASTLPAM